MPAVLIRHRVADFTIWKAVYDEFDFMRRAHGCQGWQLFRSDDEPDEMLILLTWDDLDRARLFAQSDDLREAMTRAGVADEPDLWFLDEIDRTHI